MSSGVCIGFERIAKTFGTVEALRPMELTVKAREFFTLLGPSGSGKTTLLNIAAGYVTPTSGRVLVEGVDITLVPPRKRNMGMVFQNYALFPHLSVFDNVAYGLRARRMPVPDVRRRVEEALALLQLADLGGRRIPELSGGQQQRVALARALVIEPSVLLMDEPLGALDRQLRKRVQFEIRHLHLELGRTTLYVTHDQEEAVVMSDRIGIMRGGQLIQVGTARELYEEPANAFVAGFLGESNLLAGTVQSRSGEAVELRVPGLRHPVQGLAGPGIEAGAVATALIRPEHVRLGDAAGETVEARVQDSVYLGDMVAIRLAVPGGPELWCRRLARDGMPPGGIVAVSWRSEDVRILPD